MKSVIYSILVLFIVGFAVQSCEKESQAPIEITGQLISNTDCKEFLKSAAGATTPDSLSCIEYSYNSDDSTLTIKHINAGFNCCPESLYCTVTTSGDTILIEENEKSALCDCDCLYDLDIEINGVVEGIYHIRMIEPYARDMDELSFEIDLSEEKTGSFCVVRKRYPWGMESVD